MNPDSKNLITAPLRHLQVVELGCRVGTGFAGRLLADLGASVVRVGPARTTDSRGRALGLALDRGKSRIDGTREQLTALSAGCDLVLTDDDADDQVRAMLSVLTVHAPQQQVVVHASDFGRTGPRAHWRGTELLAAAYGGGCQMNGEPGRAPLRPPAYVGDHELGLNLAIAALLARISAVRDELGQDVEVSAVDCWATIQTAIGTLEYIFQGRIAMRAGRRFGGRAYPYTMLNCSDGEIRLICLQGREWARSLEMMGSPEWGRDPRFADRLVNQAEHADELDALIEDWLRDKTKDGVLADSIQHKVPWVPVRTVAEVLDEPQLRERGFFWRSEDTDVPGVPAKFSRTTLEPPVAHPEAAKPPVAGPAPGEPDSPSTPTESDRSRSESFELAAPPLQGLRVLDFGWAWAGGIVGSVLADFGADVIKIESRRRLDPMRMDRALLPGGDRMEQSALHHNVNRNKRSISIDVTKPAGADLVRRLAAEADIVLENFSPGALTRQGLGPQQLTELNPRLVYVSVGAVGAEGPLTGVRAYAPVLTALSGMDSLVGYPGEQPLGLQHGLADPNAGLFAVLATLAALLERRTSGRGQYVDVSQLEALVSLLGVQLALAQTEPDTNEAMGNRDPEMSPHGIFRAAGDDKWVAIACPDDAAWTSLVQAMGKPSWATRPDLATRDGRRAQEAAVEAGIERWTSTLSAAAAAESIQRAGGYAAPLQDTGDRFADEHLQARQTYVAVEHPVVGTEFVYGVPWILNRTPGSVRSAAPLLGQHTDDVLREDLKMSDDEISQLREAGVLT